MEIICPICNKSYNIPVERLPKKRASAKCKNCGHEGAGPIRIGQSSYKKFKATLTREKQS